MSYLLPYKGGCFLKKFEVICVDMFQTLVNVYTRRKFIWKRILGKEYSKKSEEEYAKLIDKKVIEKFHKHASNDNDFANLKMIFNKYFSEVFEELKLNIDPWEATSIFIEEHGFAESYEDSNTFLETVSSDYPVCLVSDADIEMVKPLLTRFKFDKVFISEEAKAYKKHSEGKIFKQVLKHYNVEPEKIIHIGDSSSDILGASRVGIATCWINRHNHSWRDEVKPMYKVASLSEVLSILRD